MLLDEDEPIPLLTATKSRQVMEIRSNTYVIFREGWYHTFPIKVDPARETKHLIFFEKTPPVLLEGLAIVNRRVYEVTIDDLFRSIIRKSRLVNLKKQDHDNSADTDNASTIRYSDVIEDDPSGTGSSPVSNAGGHGLSCDEPGLEVIKNANDAWQDQVSTLLHTLNTEEGGEWEIEDPAQSQPVDESGAVQDIDPFA